MKYVIQYTYDWIQQGCDCCVDWDSEMSVFEEHRVHEGVYTYHSNIPTMYDEQDLRQYVNETCPEFNNFELHPNSYFA